MFSEDFHTVFLILKVQVYSPASADLCLLAQEGILDYGEHTVIRIPRSGATALNEGPVAGERHFIRYVDGIQNCSYDPEFRFLGIDNDQFIFSNAPA